MRGLLFSHYENEGRKSLGTAKDGTKVIGHLKHLDKFFRNRLALSVDAQLLDEFITKRKESGAQNGTVNRELSHLRKMFSLAVERKKLRQDHVPKFPKLKEAEARDGFLEPEDLPRLRESLPEYLRPVLTLAFYTAGCGKARCSASSGGKLTSSTGSFASRTRRTDTSATSSCTTATRSWRC